VAQDHQPITNNVAAPTAAELSGAFFSKTPPNTCGLRERRHPLYPSTTGGAGTGGRNHQHPSCCISAECEGIPSQIFSKFQANYTTVNAANGFTNGSQLTSFSTLNNFRQDLVRVDHYFNDRLHFFARGMQDDAPSNLPTGLWGGANYPGSRECRHRCSRKNVVANLTWTISPKMVNEVEFAYSQGTIKGALSGPANSPSVLSSLTNNLANPDPYGRIPSVTILDGSVTGVSQGSAPYFERNLDRNIFDNFSVTLGNHTIRAGVTAQQMLKTEDASEGNPSFNFNTWGDFLLGNATQYSQASRDIVPDLRFWNTEAFVQDDWKLNHRLDVKSRSPLDEFPSPPMRKNTLVNFDPLVYKAAQAPALDSGGNFVAGQLYTPATYANGLIFPKGAPVRQLRPSPRRLPALLTAAPSTQTTAGTSDLAWALPIRPSETGKTVLRGGFGSSSTARSMVSGSRMPSAIHLWCRPRRS
jgi:hypothetical protein